MNDPIRPPSWLTESPRISETNDNKRTYTYTLNLSGNRKIGVEFKESVTLSTKDLATRELAHMLLLKSMFHIEKKVKNIFTEGTVVKLITDKPENLVESTKSNVSITTPDNRTSYYESEKKNELTPITSNTPIPLLPFKLSHKRNIDLLQRLEVIRKIYFTGETGKIDPFAKVESPPAPGETSATVVEEPVTHTDDSAWDSEKASEVDDGADIEKDAELNES